MDEKAWLDGRTEWKDGGPGQRDGKRIERGLVVDEFDLPSSSRRSDHGMRILCMLGASYRLRKPGGNRMTFTDDNSFDDSYSWNYTGEGGSLSRRQEVVVGLPLGIVSMDVTASLTIKKTAGGVCNDRRCCNYRHHRHRTPHRR